MFLPRHGRGHRIPPTQLNYRANIDALKRAGVTDMISLSRGRLPARRAAARALSSSSTSSSTAPSRARRASSATGCVAHVSMAHPVCPRLGDALEAAARGAGIAGRRAAAPTW